MRRTPLQKLCSLVIVLVLVTISIAGFCRSGHACHPDYDSHASLTSDHASHGSSPCPTCPQHDHSTPGHCDCSCHCDCHAPLGVEPVLIGCSLIVTPIQFHETTKFIPEVFLSIFIPPQNA